MPESTVTKSARGISPLVLVLAALCFLLPFVGVSCNTTAGGAALGGALSQFGASPSSSGNAAVSCLHALNGKDLVSYSGINMLTGSDPSTATTIPGCESSTSTPAAGTSPGGIGVQPLLVAALVLIIVGVVAAALPARLRPLAGGGAALLAALLIVVNNAAVHGTVLNRITQEVTRQGGSSLSNFGVSAGVGSFFDIHAAIGFTLVLVALAVAIAVNAVALLSGPRPAPAPGASGAAPPAGPTSAAPPAPWPPPGDRAPPPGPPAAPG